MRGILAAIAFAMLASLVHADVIYLHCPTIFTKSVSVITANYYKDTVTGPPRSQPAPSCVGLNVSIDGQNALTTECITPGVMNFTLSTPTAKTYTITGTSSAALYGGDDTTVTCSVKRSSFNVAITVPDVSWTLVPLLGLGGILLLRRKQRR